MRKTPKAPKVKPCTMTQAERTFLHKVASALAQKYRYDAERHLFDRQDICDAATAVLAEEKSREPR